MKAWRQVFHGCFCTVLSRTMSTLPVIAVVPLPPETEDQGVTVIKLSRTGSVLSFVDSQVSVIGQDESSVRARGQVPDV